MFTKQTKLQILKNKSSKIIDVFTKTVSDLTIVNQEIDQEREVKINQLQEIDQEITSLNDVKTSNDKIINRINTILN
jgi:hypothetical protein